ncbi:hypothetical protein PYJP_17180 [Pyrofollis japonicus]|nr:hypothetical protein PYJP_17180 [Pyrofollis japonicus]
MSLECSVSVIDGVYYCEEASWRAPVFRDRWDAGEKLAAFLETVDQ